MFRCPRMRISLCVLMSLTSAVISQQANKQQAKPTVTGKAWMVVKVDLQDWKNQWPVVEILADFAEEQPARDYASQLQDAEKNWSRWLYDVHKRKAGDDAGAPASPIIQMPKKPTVDVKPIPNKPAPALSGKKFVGTIGRKKVTIAFDKDKFTISGELQGAGEYVITETAGIVMKTEIAKYVGNINGDTIKGVRFFKDGTPFQEWKVELEQKAAASAPQKANVDADGLEGRYWSARSRGGSTFSLKFHKDGRLEAINSGAFLKDENGNWEGNKSSFRGTWVAKTSDGFTVRHEIKGSLDQNQIKAVVIDKYSDGTSKEWEVVFPKDTEDLYKKK